MNSGDQFNFGAASVLFISGLSVFALFSFICLIFYETDKKDNIVWLWFSIVSVFLVYFSMDIILGYFFIPRLSPPMLPDKYVNHKLAPDTNSEYKSREFLCIQKVNSLGLRGAEVQEKKKSNTYRIIMLGDSFTMGRGVSDHETFSVLLEESLNKKKVAPNSKKIEILNAGVDSYAPVLSFLQLKKMADLLEPDLVILNFDMSDLIQEVTYRNKAIYGKNDEIIGVPAFPGQLDTQKMGSVKAIKNWVNKNLYFSRLVIFYLEKWTGNPKELSFENTVNLANYELLKHTLMNDTVDRTIQWQKIFESILKIKKYCIGRGMKFILTVYPWGHQVNESEWTPGRLIFVPDNAPISDKSIQMIQNFAKVNSIELLNSFPGFRSYKGTEPLYFSYDMHWTPEGHKLMAREIEQFILERIFKVQEK